MKHIFLLLRNCAAIGGVEHPVPSSTGNNIPYSSTASGQVPQHISCSSKVHSSGQRPKEPIDTHPCKKYTRAAYISATTSNASHLYSTNGVLRSNHVCSAATVT